MINLIKAQNELKFESYKQAKQFLKGKSIWIVFLTDDLSVKEREVDMIISDNDTMCFKCKLKDPDYPSKDQVFLSCYGKLIFYKFNAKFFETKCAALEYAYQLSKYYAEKLNKEYRRYSTLVEQRAT